MSETRVSIVIPTRNHKPILERLLGSISGQSMAPEQYEVIIVDDGSTDGTKEFLQAAEFPFRLRLVEGERSGPPRARNAGLALAESPVVAFMDDDVTLHTECLERALQYFATEDVGVVETTLLIEGEDGSERPLQLNAGAQGFVTAAIFFRREALIRVNGFDPDFFDPDTGMFFRDDADIGFRVLKAGYKALQPADVVAWHPVQFPAVERSFAHVKRYMFDPLLYRKHPQMFRMYIERKQVGPFSFARPMHYSCLLFIAGLAGAAGFGIAGVTTALWGSLAVSVAAHLVLRYKFCGADAWKFWRLKETLAYTALPVVYLYWFGRGIRKFGGWKSIL